MDKIKKEKIYRSAGRICLGVWFICAPILLFLLCPSFVVPTAKDAFYTNIFLVLAPLFINLFYNPFLIVGIIFLWRADKNSLLVKKSKWLKVLVIYITAWFCLKWLVLDRLTQRQYDQKHFITLED